MKALTIIVMFFMAVFMATNVLAEPGLSISTTDHATVGALYDLGDYLLTGTEFGITKLHKSNGSMEFFNDRTNGLPSERVSALTIDTEGKIWIGYLDETHFNEKPGGGGLAILDGNNVTVFRSGTSDLPTNTIKSLATDHEGNVWIGTATAGLVKYDGTNMTVYDRSNSDIPHITIITDFHSDL